MAALTTRSLRLEVPASSANLGPGFDTLGLALALNLEIAADFTPSSGINGNNKSAPLAITIQYSGSDAATVPADPAKNLISKTLLEHLTTETRQRVHGAGLHLAVTNPIPLGRGLGSSGSAVVAGVVLAHWVAHVAASPSSGSFAPDLVAILDQVVAEEGHPDNVAPSLLGGLVTSYMATAAGGAAASRAYSVQLPFDRVRIEVLAVIPDYHTPTDLARAALPGTYSTAEVVHSLQRVATLTHVLSGNPAMSTPAGPHLTPRVFAELLDDVVHQPHRAHLIPGFTAARQALTAHQGILGACVSGAGPTVLVFAQRGGYNFDAVKREIESAYAGLAHPEHQGRVGISVDVRRMEVAEHGTVWNEHS
ncbi:GHMP kinase [Blastocladiella britannica]|nr:GHMP kinase [Blastocladiella britannica]